MSKPKYIEEYSDIELHIELHRRQAKSIQAKQREAQSDPSKEHAKVESAYVKDGRVEIRMSDGREVSVCLDGRYNPNIIKVLYHSHEWAWDLCHFDNYNMD